MQMRELDDRVSVAYQIEAADVDQVAAMGFGAIMCNRPDGEEPGQPDWAEIAARAEALGLKTFFVPIGSREPDRAALEAYAAAMRASDRLFAYCRTGTRCEILWRMVKAQGLA